MQLPLLPELHVFPQSSALGSFALRNPSATQVLPVSILRSLLSASPSLPLWNCAGVSVLPLWSRAGATPVPMCSRISFQICAAESCTFPQSRSVLKKFALVTWVTPAPIARVSACLFAQCAWVTPALFASHQNCSYSVAFVFLWHRTWGNPLLCGGQVVSRICYVQPAVASRLKRLSLYVCIGESLRLCGGPKTYQVFAAQPAVVEHL
mmetsp:Transcript_30409/g.54163  ORF Transcript_30409/g.54163 Transcript_30409/m.54163 type:complete len:208 (+) Transcript_30409:107-730(+)